MANNIETAHLRFNRGGKVHLGTRPLGSTGPWWTVCGRGHQRANGRGDTRRSARPVTEITRGLPVDCAVCVRHPLNTAPAGAKPSVRVTVTDERRNVRLSDHGQVVCLVAGGDRANDQGGGAVSDGRRLFGSVTRVWRRDAGWRGFVVTCGAHTFALRGATKARAVACLSDVAIPEIDVLVGE